MRLNPSQRYWLSMLGIVVGTIAVAGLAGGTVARLVGERSLLAGAVVVLIFLMGWQVGVRVRERKKLDLPLWRGLDEDQARQLAQYREFTRTGRITQPGRREVSEASRTQLSARDRARIADVERQRKAREHSDHPEDPAAQ
ncbi:MAG: hypothetical protein SO046_08245 [Actinomyces urogenitalis]|uniref:hypothetical protein n=1 Tax=Actinomyces urogenitalis TaxID=103621 RepID=UPI002A80641F|nr:hypothetical protein [Actinomyces urogenitalis]MDY3679183.1 hypothetical protein [Actinomyces urogenitalis]